MFKGRHFDRSVILLCVRWYLACSLSLRDLEEMMAERGITVDHAAIHRWTVHYAPLLLEQFNRHKRPVTGEWHVDETYIKVRANGDICIAPSTATMTLLNSGSASGETSLRPSGFFARPLRDTVGQIGLSSTAAKPIAKQSWPAIP